MALQFIVTETITHTITVDTDKYITGIATINAFLDGEVNGRARIIDRECSDSTFNLERYSIVTDA
jgi:hypothetical protein